LNLSIFFRDLIRQSVNASENDVVIFTSSGCTGAIHKLIHALNLKAPPVRILIYFLEIIASNVMAKLDHISDIFIGVQTVLSKPQKFHSCQCKLVINKILLG